MISLFSWNNNNNNHWLNSAYFQKYLVRLQLSCLATLQGMLALALCLLLCRDGGKMEKMWDIPATEGSAPCVQSLPFLQRVSI